jgi:hypothetical protein
MTHTDTKYWFTSSSGRIEFQLTREQVMQGHHQGACDDDVEALASDPTIADQLSCVSTDIMALELREYGAWSPEELEDRDANIRRLIWLACSDIQDQQLSADDQTSQSATAR